MSDIDKAITRMVEHSVNVHFMAIEAYITRYLADTGARIEELELVERREVVQTVYYLQKRTLDTPAD